MNKADLLNVLLAIALVILSVKVAFFSGSSSSKSEGDTISAETAVFDNIMTRTSVRAYQDRPIEDEKVEKMLQAAMAAPTAANKQPWKFIIIKDKNTLKTIADHFHTMTMAAQAPMAIVVCGDMSLTLDRDGRDYWIEDTSAATENLLLAAHSMGLGAVWCGIYPQMERVKYLSELLKLPEDIVPLNVIPVGYPAEDPAPKDKWKPESVHYESWTGETLAPRAAEAKEWKQMDVKRFRENPFDFFSNALALTVGTKEKMNSMTIGWGGLGVLWGRERPVVTVYVEKRRYTHSFMEENEYFTVEAFGPEQQKVLEYLGHVSGRDEDKIKGSGLTVKFTDLGTPMFDEGRLVLECKKLYGAPFNPEGFGELAKEEYSKRPLHSVYIGEIVNAWIKE
jgi:nitroreductase/flavin reductase (DIM6/NTAB) family NADH-FMN oxidoreductase RutF